MANSGLAFLQREISPNVNSSLSNTAVKWDSWGNVSARVALRRRYSAVEYGLIIACDDEDCLYEWFHWGCEGVREEPVGKWFCSTCRKT